MEDTSSSSSLVPMMRGGGGGNSGNSPLGSTNAGSSSSEDEEGGDRRLSGSTTAAAAAAITDNANRSASQLTAQMIMQKGKYGVAMFITNELAREKLQLTASSSTSGGGSTTSSTASGTGAPPSSVAGAGAGAAAAVAAVNNIKMSSTTSTCCGAATSAATANSIAIVNATGTGGGGAIGSNSITVGATGATTSSSSVRAQKPIDLEHHLRASGTVPKQQQQQQQQFHPLDMSIGGDVTMMDSGGHQALVLASGGFGECCDTNDPAYTGSHYLNLLLDDLLMPDKRINDPETIDWCKWLIAGGRIPEDFAQIVRGFDNNSKCGLVWIPHVVAYRCRTCGISPCMSICRECFKKGDHATHDFNMFLSQAGGACDCGDTSVMKPEGFCTDHGLNHCIKQSPVPKDLMLAAKGVMPRLLLRLLLHFRCYGSKQKDQEYHNFQANDCDDFCSFLMELNNMGELMRSVMTATLLNPEIYKKFVEGPYPDTPFGHYLKDSQKKYRVVLKSFPYIEPPDDYRHLPALAKHLKHTTLLEEFIFWTFKFEFPQNIVCFLLNMLPDLEYKEQLTRTFVMHYSRIPTVLEMSRDPDTLSNRVVHMSVQLFSNEDLALKMVNELNLLHVMIISLKLMMSKILIKNTLHDPEMNFHYVIDCAKRVMKEHCYWPLVSDFNNVLSHESVALVFLRNDELIEMWFQFLSMLQGMNVNIKETGNHVEFEPSSYYAAFSCELEASAYPMWSIISHLQNASHAALTKNILKVCINYLEEWLDSINFSAGIIMNKQEMNHASFHLPLHRYLAAFTCQAVKTQGLSLKDILPPPAMLQQLMIHPLKVQSLFYEILAGVWVRNGLQIKGQAMTYIQANFCNSFVDMDLYFLQLCATNLPASMFLETAIQVFNVTEWLSLMNVGGPQESEPDSMMEGLLTFLATLVTSRTNMGNDDATQCKIEISSLLSTGDRTHSQLLELMPERSGNVHTRNFESFLRSLSTYRSPPMGSENLEQGLFIPTAEVWEHFYDPLHVLLRAVHRRDFQSSMDRFAEYVKGQKTMPASQTLWPPFRLPDLEADTKSAYVSPTRLLNTRVMHAAALGILYRAMHQQNVSENLLALAVFLLEVAVDSYAREQETTLTEPRAKRRHQYPELLDCFPTDCLVANLRTVVHRVAIRSREPQFSPANYKATFGSYYDWDVFDSDRRPPMLAAGAEMGVVEFEDDEDDDENEVVVVRHPIAAAAAAAGGVVAAGTSMELSLPQDVVMMEDEDDDDDDMELHNDVLMIEQMSAAATPEVMLEGTENNMLVPFAVNRPASSMAGDLVEMAVTPTLMISGESAGEGSSSSGGLVGGSHTNRSLVERRTKEDKSGGGGMMADGEEETVLVDESIISLLLKLHSQLSNTLDSFSLDDVDAEEMDDPASGSSSRQEAPPTSGNSRIGDGPHFIGNLLRKIAKLDGDCAREMRAIRQRLWPNQRERQAEQKSRELKEKEDRSVRAKQRQMKLMQEFANKQKRFMEQAAAAESGGAGGGGPEVASGGGGGGVPVHEEAVETDEDEPVEKVYDCIICNQTSASTENDPIGLVVLVESSSVTGHRRRSGERSKLPLCDEDREEAGPMLSMSQEFNRRIELMSEAYGKESWYFGQNLGWEGGVHVQSCGHHVHLTCHDAYRHSLFTSQRPQNLMIERGEFLCPFCRQLSNCVLPLGSQKESVLRRGSSGGGQRQQQQQFKFFELVHELRVIFMNSSPVAPTRRSDAIRRAMDVMTESIQQQHNRVLPNIQHTMLLPLSIARTNLEAEVIQRGGSLCSNNEVRYKPKRDCIVPLLNVLSTHLRIIANLPMEWRCWARLCGLPMEESKEEGAGRIPLLVTDPTALMLKYILLSPVHLSQGHFTCIVKATFNLLFFQVVLQLCGNLGKRRLEQIRQRFPLPADINAVRVKDLGSAMALMLNELDTNCVAGMATTQAAVPPPDSDELMTDVTMNRLEQELQALCLPFLRVAALIRHHMYMEELPGVGQPSLEFVRLVYFLELVQSGMDWRDFNASKALCFLPEVQVSLPVAWCAQLRRNPSTESVFKELVPKQHVAWQQPRLLSLPREYEKLFTYYHEQTCANCHMVPLESSICLFCGAIVCLKQHCCKTSEGCEAVRHSLECGGGTGIFLVVTSTYIIVIRGRRACLWGSLYLDDYDEEDRDLKRGKPLYLSEDRFNLLESQWLSHRFAHTKHSWVWHRDSL